MKAETITLIILSLLLCVMGILLFIGKGDWLISGYNTASAEERAEYNIGRLRLIMGVTCFLIMAVMIAEIFCDAEWLIYATILPISILVIILSNTWAKN